MAMTMLKCCQSPPYVFRSLFMLTANLKTSARHTTGAYYVLLPETPPDSADDNAILQFEQTPKFSVISPVRCITGCAKLAIGYETRLNRHIESLRNSTDKKTFNNIFDPIEKISVPLNTAWRTSKNLNFMAGVDYSRAFLRVHSQVAKSKSERWNNTFLYRASKELKLSCQNLDEFQHQLLSLQLLKGRLNGIELEGAEKKRFVDTQKVLGHEQVLFRQRVTHCQSLFSHRIEDFSVLTEIPKHLLSRMTEDQSEPSRGPWYVTLHPHIYTPFLEHCSDRTLRWNAWNAYNNRASVNFVDRNLGNHKLIEELRQYRRDIANMLGYDNFAEMSVETKMAGSVENILDMIETLRKEFLPQAQKDIADLQEFAESEGFIDQLQAWDLPYWRRRHRDHLYKLDQNSAAQYFPLNTVLEGLFNLCQALFKITIKDCSGKVETWHEDVRYFEVYNENQVHIGSFFFDPYSRSGVKQKGVWMEMGRERSKLLETIPYSFLVMNLEKPTSPSSSAVLLQHKEVLFLFHVFGHGLQQLMTKVPYSDLAGQNNMQQDALRVCANFMQRWALEPSVLQNLSCHHSMGASIPDDLLKHLLLSHHHFSAFDMMKQLYLSAFDMDIYLSKTHWHDVMTRVWRDYLPLPLSPYDYHPCSFTHIFSDQYPASYYSFLWSNMIAADIFAAFREGGLNNDKNLGKIGKRFTDSFLSLGGGVSAGEVFRRFRGRDPSVEALIEEKSASDRM